MRWSLCLVLSACVGWLSLLPAGEMPTFTEESASEQFSKGMELFVGQEWKEAEKQFKACQKKTDRAGKKIVKSWIEGCKGGRKLGKIEKAMAQENWPVAHAQLAALQGKYGQTPLGSYLRELTTQVEKELFVALATYEKEAPEAERAAAGMRRMTDAAINKDPKYVKSGEGSLRWKAAIGSGEGRINYLALARFDVGTLEEFRFLHLSVFNPETEFASFNLIFDLDNLDELARSGPLQARVFSKEIQLSRAGWTDFRIDLRKDLTTFAGVERGEVEGVGLTLSSPKPKTIYIDDVRFER